MLWMWAISSSTSSSTWDNLMRGPALTVDDFLLEDIIRKKHKIIDMIQIGRSFIDVEVINQQKEVKLPFLCSTCSNNALTNLALRRDCRVQVNVSTIILLQT